MFSLRALFSKPVQKEPELLPYMDIQRYFQLFNPQIYNRNTSASLADDEIRIPGNILKAFNCPDHRDFFSADTHFLETGSYTNSHGGRILYGEYRIQRIEEPLREYFYFCMATHTPSNDYQEGMITPHFLLVGEMIMTDDHQSAYLPVFLVAQTILDDDGSVLHHFPDLTDDQQVLETLSFADLPFRSILGDLNVAPCEIAECFLEQAPAIRTQKYLFAAEYRNHEFLMEELNEFRSALSRTPSL